ncbi:MULTISPECIES: TrbG/VirB9 family P-type conjugative transfer protein [Candidatus Ichthyocystis]|uniref:Putative conjugal transfer protein n=1 Tax=Candidatus Ichthyocystis hellenicum TaxID=1561003 RepID=A0A0S4M142_9BURK|nr:MULTISPECIES: TrbG/VirB9 family P-type conjugative transfer protein [Ichthyocystis]CUT17495.1 putative conjugal transfer protein [Candidatus Ichthyocystis hellenicum]
MRRIIILCFAFLSIDSFFIGPSYTFAAESGHNKGFRLRCDDYLLEHFHICHPPEHTLSDDDSDPAIAIFDYRDDRTYVVYTHVGIMTDISFPADELLKGVFLSDTSRWVHAISQSKQDIFFKPTKSHLINPITILTSKRRYQVWLVSVDDNHYWYHRVSWRSIHNGDVSGFSAMEVSLSHTDNNSSATDNVPSYDQVDVGQLNFDYVISSNGSSVAFMPDAVFDDRTHVWIRMPVSLSYWPALFVADRDGKLMVEEYIVQGRYYKVAHVHYCVILKSGRKMVRVCKREPFSIRKIIHNVFHPSFLQRHL